MSAEQSVNNVLFVCVCVCVFGNTPHHELQRWNLSDVLTLSPAPSLRSPDPSSSLWSRCDVNAFYFGVLRRVAKGSTGGVTAEAERGKGGGEEGDGERRARER